MFRQAQHDNYNEILKQVQDDKILYFYKKET